MRSFPLILALFLFGACAKPPLPAGDTPHAYETRDGLAVVQDDIILGAADRAAVRAAAGAGGTGARLWPDGLVPYVLDADAPTVELTRAFAHFHERTSIRFVPRTTESDYVRVRRSTGWCGSLVGREGGEQPLPVSADCSLGNLVHELGHLVGLFHEQNRSDRDQYVRIAWENVIPGSEPNFAKDASSRFPLLASRVDIGEYDITSIMQSPVDAFSRNGSPTIVANNGAPIIGQRRELSRRDVFAIAALYEGSSTRINGTWQLGSPGRLAIVGDVTVPADLQAGKTVWLEVYPAPGVSQPPGASHGTSLVGGVLSTGPRTVRFRIEGLGPGSYIVAIHIDGSGNLLPRDSGDYVGYHGGTGAHPVLDASSALPVTLTDADVAVTFGVAARN